MEIIIIKQKTAYEMSISDWSSDVCSSDLQGDLPGPYRLAGHLPYRAGHRLWDEDGWRRDAGQGRYDSYRPSGVRHRQGSSDENRGRRQRDRKSVVSGKSVLVRVDTGGRRIITTKNLTTSHNISHSKP